MLELLVDTKKPQLCSVLPNLNIIFYTKLRLYSSTDTTLVEVVLVDIQVVIQQMRCTVESSKTFGYRVADRVSFGLTGYPGLGGVLIAPWEDTSLEPAVGNRYVLHVHSSHRLMSRDRHSLHSEL